MSLEEVVQKYKEAQALINTEIENIPYQNRAGFMMRRGDAQQNLHSFHKTYGDELSKVAFGVCVLGDDAEAFVTLAKEAADVITVDASAFLSRLVLPIEEAMGMKREFMVQHLNLLGQGLMSMAIELGVTSFQAPRWKDEVNVSTKEGLVSYVKSVVDSSVGPEFSDMYLKKLIVDSGLKGGIVGKTVPVLVTGLDNKYTMNRIFADRNLTVTPKNPTNELVLEVFNKIKKQLKGK